MALESRPFEHAFQSADQRQLFGKPEAEPLIDDFNTFFEKLSALEESGWSDQLAPGAPKPKSGSAPTAAAAKASMPARLARPSVPAAPRPPARRMPMAFRLAMSALTLFIVGMTVGWAALNLPQHVAGLLPSLVNGGSTSTSWQGDPAATVPEAPAPLVANLPLAGGEKTAAPAASNLIVESTKPATAAAVAPVAPSAPQQAIAEATTSSKGDEGTEPESNPDDAAPAVTQSGGNASPVETAQAAAPQADAAKPATPAAGSNASGSFALQVGACRSSGCVDNYRRLVTPHVDGKTVHVVASQGSAGVQRVRVEPLAKDQALELKQALADADPRLKNAYLVRITR